MVQTLQAQTI